MRIDKLRKVLSGLQEGEDQYFPKKIGLEVVSYLTLLWVKGEREEMGVYARFPLTNAWCRASRILLNITRKRDWDPVDVKDIDYWLGNLVFFVYGSRNPSFSNVSFERKDFWPYLKELVGLYARFRNGSGEEDDELIEFLLSDDPIRTLLKFCTNTVVFNIYSLGLEQGLFPGIEPEQNEDLMLIVDTLHKAGLIAHGYNLAHLYKVEDLDDWQIEYMLERGCSNLVEEAWLRGMKIPDTYQEEVDRLEMERRLSEEVPTLRKAVEVWNTLSQEEKIVLQNRFGKEKDKKVNVLGHNINPLNIALLDAGITELGLLS